MAYNPQQIYDAGSAMSQAGMSNPDIFSAIQQQYGVSPASLADIYQTSRPDLFTQWDETAGLGLNGLAALRTDPRMEALIGMKDYASQFEPDAAPNIHDINNLPPGYRSGGPGTSIPGTRPGGGGGGNMYLSGTSSFSANPNLGGMADDITRRTNLSRDMGLQAIRGNHVGNGSLGGSRQGVAEGLAISGTADNIAGQLANLYGRAWDSDQTRGLQKYGMDQSAYLTNQGQQMGFYGNQRQQDLTQLGLGAEIYDRGVKGGWIPLNQASGIFNTTAGNNVTSTSGGTQGAGWQGLLGGALSGATLGRQAGWW